MYIDTTEYEHPVCLRQQEMDTEEIRAHNQRILEDQHRILVRLEQDSAKTFDKAVLLLGGGTLGLSLTFLKDFVGELQCTFFLIFSWVVIILSLFIILLSPLLSMKASQEQRLINEEYYSNETIEKPRKNTYSKWTARSNFWSAILLIAGIVSFVIFVFNNFDQNNMKTEGKKIWIGTAAESAVPPTPLMKMDGGKCDVIKSVVPPAPPPKVTPSGDTTSGANTTGQTGSQGSESK